MELNRKLPEGDLSGVINAARNRVSLDVYDRIYSILYILTGYLYTEFFLFEKHFHDPALSLEIFTVLYFALTLSYAHYKKARVTRETLFWMSVTLIVSFRVSHVNGYICFPARILSAGYYTYSLGNSFTDGAGTSDYLPFDLAGCFILMPFASFFTPFRGAFELFRTKKEGTSLKEKLPVLRGILMGTLALSVILPQLFSADANFLKGLSDRLDKFIRQFDLDLDLIEFVFRTAFSLPVGCYLFSLLFNSAGGHRRGRISRETADSIRKTVRGLPAVTVMVCIYMVAAVYMLFIAAQFRYLFGALTGHLYEGLTYSEYAVRGFWELCRVCLINLSILAFSFYAVKEDESAKIRTRACVLCVISLALLGTAVSKMYMYISAYGLTPKRIISSVFLFWLVIFFVLVILDIYSSIGRIRMGVFTGAVLFTLLFSFDLNKGSERYNLKYGYESEVRAVREHEISDCHVYDVNDHY